MVEIPSVCLVGLPDATVKERSIESPSESQKVVWPLTWGLLCSSSKWRRNTVVQVYAAIWRCGATSDGRW